jgi:glycosyltransferase involved in cell wall biosynthesis
MRIGIFYETTFPEFKGGVERWFSQLANGMSEKNLEVQYFNTGGRITTENNVKYISLESKTDSFQKTGTRSSQNALSFAISVFKGLKNHQLDIIYLSAFPFFHIWTSKLAQIIFRKNYIIYVEWFELPSLKFWIKEFGLLKGVVGSITQRLSVRMANVNVCYLESTRNQLEAIQKNRQITLKLPGICVEETKTPPVDSRNLKNNICQIGRLTPDKQPLLGLAAIKLLRNRGWTGQFKLIGSGPLERDIINYLNKNDMSEYVSLYVDGNDDLREEILNDSAVLLHPSKREGFGLAIVEAAAVGVPTILIKNVNNKSTELGINPTLIAESSSPQEIATLLEKVLSDQDKYMEECRLWNILQRPKFLAKDSIDQLANHFHNTQRQRKI